ncbi:Cytochrome P450 82C4 [Morus notabilis]|uniref:Cytochrome P450 82C4 n=1 Tax=Morus notabilis TaxID=981085 RepID=W9RMS9_9ROSA|nr:Cytochrome P450 82C4 [Morus notabilis]
MADIADKYGPIFLFRLGMNPVLVISNYEAVKECFTTNDITFASRPSFCAKPSTIRAGAPCGPVQPTPAFMRSWSTHGTHLGYDFAAFGFAPYGPYWRTMRKLVMIELLSNRRLETLRHVQVSEVETLVNGLYGQCKKNGFGPTEVVISEWIEHFTLNIITEMIAGKRYFDSSGKVVGGEAERIGKVIKEYMCISGAFIVSDLIPVPKWVDFNGNLKAMKRIGREIDVLIQSWVEEHKRSEASDKQDFIDIMLSLIEENHELGYARDTIIKGTVSTLIIAGSDTTAINLTWILALLLNNRRALNRAQEELDLIVGKERWVEGSDIKNLVYLQAIVKETLRLYPPGPLAVPHQAREDCTVCGFHVRKGTRLFVNLWKLHRDPNTWPDPEAFSPERFLTSHAGIDVLGQHFELIPFGSGRRSCPGMAFALQVTHLALARLLQGFVFATKLDEPVDMSEGLGITLPRATPVEAVLTPRLPAELYQH